ncbi:hypothetical protein [Streptomyces bungoensis]|uniref:hypothetical protein n=1 Tax=Streptomyces bungoensis TaxID=285568 RepID=UPI0034174AFC
MGWENNGKERPESGRLWTAADLGAAMSLGGAQLPAAGLLTWIYVSTTSDDYGAGWGGALAAIFLLIVAVVVVPVLLPLLSAVLTGALTLPSVVLARLAARRTGGPSWLWHLPAPAVPAALWGALTLPLWPLTTSVPVLTALGLLPTLWVALARGRAWRPSGVWWRAAAGLGVLFVAALVGGIVATETGLIRPYEAPRLTADRLAGVWRGEDGAELRLSPDGRAEAVRLPAQPPDYDWLDKEYVRCGGTGTWRPENRHDLDRRGIRLELDGDCGEDTDWAFGGTEDAPELFVLFGDPDGGTLSILTKA